MAASLQYSRSFLIFFSASVCFLLLVSFRDNLPLPRHEGVSVTQSQVRRDGNLTSVSNGILVDPHKHGHHPHGHHPHGHPHSLSRREDFTCASGRPCGNGACCGASGFCGYGPTYCGNGCTSNCNATAPCGQYAAKSGARCPLNTCCSQYGFCGTSQDFCDDKCQSNCVLHPKPPASGGQVLDKVVGYYESWGARLSCHKTAPTDLPLDALTHLYRRMRN